MPQCLSGPQFRTLKYCPEIPERFGSFKDGMPFGPCFFIGYNEQRHRGIALMTPAAARHSNFEIVIQPRKKPLKEAFRMAPGAFVRENPHLPAVRSRLGR